MLASLFWQPAKADYTEAAVAPMIEQHIDADDNSAIAEIAEIPAVDDYFELVDGQNTRSPFMRVFSASLPPIGYVRFCQRHPEECIGQTVFDERVELTQERWQELDAVNRFVNLEVYPVTDEELYGRVEFWTYPGQKGDCEDYVLLKRRMLIQRGWPESSLLITVVLDEDGAGHAILTARTSSGDYLLDNKNQEVTAWNSAPYRFLKRQSSRDPQMWVSLFPREEDATVAAFTINAAGK